MNNQFSIHQKKFGDLLDEALIEMASTEPNLSHIRVLIKDAKRINDALVKSPKTPHVKHG